MDKITFDIHKFDVALSAMINSDVYKLRMIENIEMNFKNKLSNLIYHYNYQTWHFSTSCALPIALLINELGIATNLGI